MYRLFAALRRAWVRAGQPFPGLTRFVRYNLIGLVWPVYGPHGISQSVFAPQLGLISTDVAVIIPCHNYGRFLADAIDSVLRQTVRPVSILVVDDASDDDTAQVAARYQEKGVTYLRVEHRSLSLTRNSGAAATESTFLLYLDADDRLPRRYIEVLLAAMKHPRTAVTYGDRQEFGERHLRVKAPAFSKEALTRQNFIPSTALLRRQAFDLVGGYRQIDGLLEDWDFYRRIVAMGFDAAYASTFLYHRMHKGSMGYQLKQDSAYSYDRIAGLSEQPVTIFTPFAGRQDVFLRYVEGLRSLSYPPSLVYLHWYNTSPDDAFDQLLRSTLSTLPFGRIAYTRAPLPALWQHTPDSLIRGRIDETLDTDYYYQLAVIRAYNAMIQSLDTEYVLTLEDDILLKPETLRTLQRTMAADVVATVAPYKSGFYSRYEIWEKGMMGKKTVAIESVTRTGIEEIDGSGFGCTLFRMEALRAIAPLMTGVKSSPKRWYDQLSYARLQSHGRILCNWDCEVEHMETERYAEKLTEKWK